MAKLFTMKPESETMRSIVLGTVAMFMQFFGYLALGIWMRPYSVLWANIMIVGAAMIYTFGLAHHVLGCAAEWIYIKSDHTEKGRKLTAEFFGKTSAVMIGCYAGIILFSVAHFIPVVAGMTPLPAWACVFNLLPLFLVQAPFNIPGAGNIVGAVMYLGLFICFCFEPSMKNTGIRGHMNIMAIRPIRISFAPKRCARVGGCATSASCGMRRMRARVGSAARAFEEVGDHGIVQGFCEPDAKA